MNAVNSSEMRTPAAASQFTELEQEHQDAGQLSEGWSEAMLELICAAAINQSFCQLLLFKPDKALDSGFNGQKFAVTPQERLLVRSIYAASLPDFVQQLEEKVSV